MDMGNRTPKRKGSICIPRDSYLYQIVQLLTLWLMLYVWCLYTYIIKYNLCYRNLDAQYSMQIFFFLITSVGNTNLRIQACIRGSSRRLKLFSSISVLCFSLHAMHCSLQTVGEFTNQKCEPWARHVAKTHGPWGWPCEANRSMDHKQPNY